MGIVVKALGNSSSEKAMHMAASWSFEKIKSFSGIPYEDLFRRCQAALRALDLEITRLDEAAGLIEARRRSRWPFKSGQEVSVTVRSNSKVTVIEKVAMGSSLLGGNTSADNMITEKLLQMVKDMA
jgi:hypothetical protein